MFTLITLIAAIIIFWLSEYRNKTHKKLSPSCAVSLSFTYCVGFMAHNLMVLSHCHCSLCILGALGSCFHLAS